MSERSPGSVPKIWPAADRPGFHKSFQLNLDDHLDIQHTTRQLLPLGPTVAAVGAVSLFVALITNFDRWRGGDMVTSAVYVVAAVVVCAVLAILLLNPARQLLRSMYRRRLTKLGIIGKPVESTVDSNGIRYTVLGQTIICTWDSLYALEEDDGTFYFWMSKIGAHPWPTRVFVSDEERQTFRRSVMEWAGRPFSPPVLARLGAAGRLNLPD
jgi:hypothetical protein